VKNGRKRAVSLSSAHSFEQKRRPLQMPRARLEKTIQSSVLRLAGWHSGVAHYPAICRCQNVESGSVASGIEGASARSRKATNPLRPPLGDPRTLSRSRRWKIPRPARCQPVAPRGYASLPFPLCTVECALRAGVARWNAITVCAHAEGEGARPLASPPLKRQNAAFGSRIIASRGICRNEAECFALRAYGYRRLSRHRRRRRRRRRLGHWNAHIDKCRRE